MSENQGLKWGHIFYAQVLSDVTSVKAVTAKLQTHSRASNWESLRACFTFREPARGRYMTQQL